MAGSKEVMLKGSVVQLSHFTKYRSVVSSNVSYSGRMRFEQLSIRDFPDELSGGSLQYAKKILGLSSNKLRSFPSASFYSITQYHLAMRYYTCITYSVDKASFEAPRNKETQFLHINVVAAVGMVLKFGTTYGWVCSPHIFTREEGT